MVSLALIANQDQIHIFFFKKKIKDQIHQYKITKTLATFDRKYKI